MIPRIVWNAIDSDDFTAEPFKDYYLRVEWMDGDDWWWRVYFNDNVVADSYYEGFSRGKSEKHAKSLCEEAFAKHYSSTHLNK